MHFAVHGYFCEVTCCSNRALGFFIYLLQVASVPAFTVTVKNSAVSVVK